MSFASEISHLKSQLEGLQTWIQQNIKQDSSKPKSKSLSPEHPCQACPKICLSSSGLKRHIQTKHIGDGILQNSANSKPEESMKSKEVCDERSQVQEESPKQSQSPNESLIQNSTSQECPLSSPVNWRRNRKKELALIIKEKLKSFYSKSPESEECDENPRKKYIIDLRTRKKYIYNNLERGVFRFTPGGGLGHTVFFNEFSDDIPLSELGIETLDHFNQPQYSNLQQIRSEADEVNQLEDGQEEAIDDQDQNHNQDSNYDQEIDDQLDQQENGQEDTDSASDQEDTASSSSDHTQDLDEADEGDQQEDGKEEAVHDQDHHELYGQQGDDHGQDHKPQEADYDQETSQSSDQAYSQDTINSDDEYFF